MTRVPSPRLQPGAFPFQLIKLVKAPYLVYKKPAARNARWKLPQLEIRRTPNFWASKIAYKRRSRPRSMRGMAGFGRFGDPLLATCAPKNPIAGSAVETVAADGNRKSVVLRQLLLDDFHKLLGKASAKPAPAFPQLPQRRRRYPSHLKNKRGQFFQRRLTLMAAVEIGNRWPSAASSR